MSNLNRITMTANKTADVMIYDQIGESWFRDGITAKGFTQTLTDLGDISQINVRINSPGGSVFEGLAIYNALKNHSATVNVSIDGLAASIATVIAMAGDKIDMAENAMFMIHEPSGVAVGTAADMLETAQLLEKLTNSAVDVYSARTGQTPDAVREAMNAETWYTAAEAKKVGFVDSISANKKLTAAYDVKQFGTAPEWVQKNLADIVNLKQEPEQMADKPDEKKPETPIDIEAIKAQAKAEERERQTKIKALCEQAKRPELSAAFCEDEAITVADVQAKLFEQLCKANGPLGDEGGTSADDKPADDGNNKYRAEFKANKYSMSESEYIAMRRIDDGLDNLQTIKK